MRLDRQFQEIKSRIMDEVERVFTSGRVLQGQDVARLETRLGAFMGMKYATGVGSCTDALAIALKAVGLKQGDKVAVTSLSFVASASAIVRAGGIPVFVDIDPESHMAREDILLDLIRDDKISGIVAVHLFGQMMELKNIYNLAKEKGIYIVEDAAQALGATRDGQGPGKFSHATCLSFDPTKVIGAQGSGGMILTNLQKVETLAKRIRYHGHAGNRIYKEIGINSQLDTVQAAILNVKMDYEEKWRRRRQEIAAQYTRAVENAGFVPSKVLPGNEHIFHKYVLNAGGQRDRLKKHLLDRDIKTTVHYNKALHLQPCFKGKSRTVGDLDQVVKTTARILSLPMYPELTDREVETITQAIGQFQR